jgi:zinc protease
MSDTGEVAGNALFGHIYKKDCVYYAPPFKEQLAQLDAINPDAIKQFHQAHITPANTVLAIVGDVNAESVYKSIEHSFASWQGGKQDSINVDDCAQAQKTAQKITNVIADKTNVDIFMGTPTSFYLQSKDFYACSLANSALGHDTISSRLAEVRTRYGYTYGIGSFFTENCYPNGLWCVNLSVNPENLNKALPLVKKIIDNYRRNGMTKEELASEASRLAGEFIVERLGSPKRLAESLTKYEFLGMGAKFMDIYPQTLKKVTLPEANAAIRKYFNIDQAVTSIAGSVKQ